MNTIVKNAFQNRNFVPGAYSDLLDSFFKDAYFENKNGKFSPKADIAEDDKKYYLSVSLPGISKEEVTIELNERILSISGEKKLIREEGKKYHTIESFEGAFKRSFKLPTNVNLTIIEADFKDGLLTISIPKEEETNLKSIIKIK